MSFRVCGLHAKLLQAYCRRGVGGEIVHSSPYASVAPRLCASTQLRPHPPGRRHRHSAGGTSRRLAETDGVSAQVGQAFACSASAMSGSVNQKVEPTPSALSTPTCPPGCVCTMARQRYRPTPRPISEWLTTRALGER